MTNSRRVLATVACILVLAGCGAKGYRAEPIAEPNSQVDTTGENFLSNATGAECFEVTAFEDDGLHRRSISLGTFCREAQ